MFINYKQTYIHDFDSVNSVMHFEYFGNHYIVHSFIMIAETLDDLILKKDDDIYAIIIKKLLSTRKIFKQFKTHEFIKPRLKKFILKVKERFYNPDAPNNFMKKHANKYVNTLGTLTT